MVNNILCSLDELMNIKTKTEATIMNGLSNFPDDEVFLALKDRMKNMFGNTECGRSNRTEGIDTMCGDEMMDEDDGFENVNEAVMECDGYGNGAGFVNEPVTINGRFDYFINDAIWEDPLFIAELCETMNRSIEQYKSKKISRPTDPVEFNIEVSPVKTMDPTQQLEDDNRVETIKDKGKGKQAIVEPRECMVTRNASRSLKIGSKLKSPFMERVVNMKLTPTDNQVSEWVLSSTTSSM